MKRAPGVVARNSRRGVASALLHALSPHDLHPVFLAARSAATTAAPADDDDPGPRALGISGEQGQRTKAPPGARLQPLIVRCRYRSPSDHGAARSLGEPSLIVATSRSDSPRPLRPLRHFVPPSSAYKRSRRTTMTSSTSRVSTTTTASGSTTRVSPPSRRRRVGNREVAAVGDVRTGRPGDTRRRVSESEWASQHLDCLEP